MLSDNIFAAAAAAAAEAAAEAASENTVGG
jgi:hypothetical protein